MNLIGIDDVVTPHGVFDTRNGSVFSAMARGARNFYESVTISLVGVLTAGAIAAATATAAPVTVAPSSFTEPAPLSRADEQWATSVGRLDALLAGLAGGSAEPRAGELQVLARRAVANAEADVKLDEWAAALAAEVSRLG